FDTLTWNQMLLKALFIGEPLNTIYGFNLRTTPELMTMVNDYIDERRSAGREIPADAHWRLVESPQYFFICATHNYHEFFIMKFFDPHIHMSSRTTDDYQAMAAAGIRAVIEPAFWFGQPRTNIGSFIDYYASLIGWERFRASQFGIAHYCAMGLNSKEA